MWICFSVLGNFLFEARECLTNRRAWKGSTAGQEGIPQGLKPRILAGYETQG